MRYKVKSPFSFKCNGSRREVAIGDTVSDSEINPGVLKSLLERGKLESIIPIKNNSKPKSKKEVIKKKKVKRVTKKEKIVKKKDETQKENSEESKILTGAIDISESGLANLSKSELKRVAVQIGIGQSGTKEILKKRILKSGI